MKILTCPLNGPRNIAEFSYGGEVTAMPDPNGCSDAEWADHLMMADNTAGIVREWWCHIASAYWFIAERNTVTDEIIRTYPASEVFKQRIDFDAPDGGGGR
ncbi:MAG: sarcosine oxidase subunit delta [Rhodospirillales bacterium]|nr:MAG: sarcosine oxidase subunit delta [Rhodospirillales bacterium]